MNNQRNYRDPSLLDLVGGIAQVLGVAEQVQRFLPTDRLRAQRRHERVARLLGRFKEQLDDARAALRITRSLLGESTRRM